MCLQCCVKEGKKLRDKEGKIKIETEGETVTKIGKERKERERMRQGEKKQSNKLIKFRIDKSILNDER